jgi:Ca2+-binding RTX toxin-like protein
MALHLNIWGSPNNWPSGDRNFVATNDPSQNRKFFFDVDWVKVEKLSMLAGSAAADRMLGSGKNDWIDAGAGADTVLAGSGDDTVFGGSSNDRLFGGAGADTLYGSGGDDKFYGGSGADDLRGGAGNDLLRGGAARDFLRGGEGADVFEFTSLSDSRPGINRDRLLDFNPRFGDKIDLHRIDGNSKVAGNQAFEFIGTREFTGNAGDATHRGEARYSDTKGGLVVSLDANGDRKADFEIFVAGLHAVKASDFLL